MQQTIKSGHWYLETENLEDDDTRNRFSHFAVNCQTGEKIELRFSSYERLTQSSFCWFKDIGFETTNSVLGYKDAIWKNSDLELAWYRKNYPHG